MDSIVFQNWLVPALLSVIAVLLYSMGRRFDKQLDKQDVKLENHEFRITKLEDK